ncbi:MAG: heme o synthase [Dehalococcoidia bacterium]
MVGSQGVVVRKTVRPAPREVISAPVLWGYVALTKPPIIGLLLVTALGGLFLASEGPPPGGIALAVLLGGALAAGGANAINHYLDRDLDALMTRTRSRPLPAHLVTPSSALAFGVGLNVLGFLVLAAGANVLSAGLALASSGFYVFVYTGWLKRRTAQNIVIGGVAGAMPPLVAWAAVTGSLGWPALFLFLIIVFWTPPHFWALALMMRDDYAAAGLPMLPVVRGERHTCRAIFVYTGLLVATTLAAYAATTLGLVFLASASVLGAIFLWEAWRVLRYSHPGRVLRLYLYSLAYLAALFLSVLVDTIIGT